MSTVPMTGLPTHQTAMPSTFPAPGTPAGGAKAFDPRFTTGTITPCTTQSATCLGAGEYSLVVTSTQPVAAVTLPVSDITAEAYVAATTVTSKVYLPNVTRTLGGPTPRRRR